MRFAYADPPYPGQAKRHYGDQPDYAGEVDHESLIDSLCFDYDGWALSTSSVALRDLLPMCPPDVRVMAWIKPFCAFKRNVNPAYAWEPVIVWRPRPRPSGGVRYMHGYRDWHETEDAEIPDVVKESITLKRGLTGAKPKRFAFWLFEVLNLKPGDDFTDMFPGTGAIRRAYLEWQQDGPWKEQS